MPETPTPVGNNSLRSRKESENSSTWRVSVFFSIVVGITGVGSYLMADYLWELGWTFSSGLLLVLFTILFGYLSFGFCHALFGFLILRLGLKSVRLSDSVDTVIAAQEGDPPLQRAAVVIPIYNEPVDRVFSGIEAIFHSVMKEEYPDAFDFFILSDSTDPEQWIDEEAAWLKLCRKTKAQDRIFYRRRPKNHAKKSGNISDFCRTWGDHYRYMIVLDADSIMSGRTLLELLLRMEQNPQVGLIQSVPVLVGGESLYGRIQQFSNRLYGPVFMEGLAFWQECGGNFWGHNAIIRLRPFIEHCDLPELPGKKPFGGHILSHDFVEAGLLRRAGWEVWMAHDLGGSYEEGPQGLIESAQRDQRWCQGNLQHSLLLAARGLRGKTRIHLANGILGYVASPLWLLFMIVAFWTVTDHGSGAFLESEVMARGLLVLGITMALLFGPKILCLIDLILSNERAKSFGGRMNAITGAIVETFFSALFAPINMLFHTRFVISNITGATVEWSAQRRGAQGTNWDDAVAVHGPHTLIGTLVGIAAAFIDPLLFWWLFPVLLGLWISIPLSVWTSQSDIGRMTRKEDMFLTPEERRPPREVAGALSGGGFLDQRFHGIIAAVLDPFLNAVHVSLLRRNRRRLIRGRDIYGDDASGKLPSDGSHEEYRALAERLLEEGPKALRKEEAVTLLSDIESMLWLHRQAWIRPSRGLAREWQTAIREISSAV